MKRSTAIPFLATCLLLALPTRSPAPLVFKPGEGWTYEPVGGEGKWRRARAKDQLEVAQQAYDLKDYSLASKAAKRVVSEWPLSDYAPQAQYLVGRCYEARGQDEEAFSAYQRLIEKYPRVQNYDEVLKRQFEITGRYLAGKWFKLWGVIPFFPSMTRTAEMYEKIIRNGPYSPVAAQAQLDIGTAMEKKSDYPSAIHAYETAADRYNDRPEIASTALYKGGMAYATEAKTAEYDQSAAGQAIALLTDFITLHPADARVAGARTTISVLKMEQARGHYEIAKFYEDKKRWAGALIYYNEVVSVQPNSTYATKARGKIEEIKKRFAAAGGQ